MMMLLLKYSNLQKMLTLDVVRLENSSMEKIEVLQILYESVVCNENSRNITLFGYLLWKFAKTVAFAKRS